MRKALLLMILISLVSGCNTENPTEVQALQSTEEPETTTGLSDQADPFTDKKKASPPEQSELPIIFEIPDLEHTGHVVISEEGYLVYNGTYYHYFSETGREIGSGRYHTASPFQEGLACAEQDGKYGFIDQNGDAAIPFTYDWAGSFSDGRAYFEIGDRYGYLDRSGSEIVVLDCDSASSFQEGMAYISVDGKYGFINTDGEIVIPLVYDDVSYFESGMAKVRTGSKFGIIDTTGKKIIPIIYDMVEIRTGFINTRSDQINRCYNINGQLLLENYEWVNSDINEYNRFLKYQSNGKRGLIDRQGNIIIPPEYDWITVIPPLNMICLRQGDQEWLASESGEMLTSVKYDNISFNPPYDAAVVQVGEKYGLLNLADLSEAAPIIYDSLSVVNNKALYMLNGKQGVMNSNGEIIVPSQDEYIYLFSNEYMAFIKKDKYCLVNPAGEPITDYEFDHIEESGDWFIVKKDHSYGFVNRYGEDVVPPIYSSLNTSDIYGAAEQQRTCFISTDGQTSKPNKYIIRTGKINSPDYNELTMRNEITPRQKEFQNFSRDYLLNSGQLTLEISTVFIKKNKILSLNNNSNPILYLYFSPASYWGSGITDSGFYSMSKGEVKAIVTGYECGGTSGGDQVCLYTDSDTSDIYIGTTGFCGGFVGYSNSSCIYLFDDGIAEQLSSYTIINQTIKNYDSSALSEKNDYLYNASDGLYTYGTDAEDQWVAEYILNEETVTREKYNHTAGRYQYIEILR